MIPEVWGLSFRGLSFRDTLYYGTEGETGENRNVSNLQNVLELHLPGRVDVHAIKLKRDM